MRSWAAAGWLAARAGATRDAAWARSSAETRRAREKQKAGRQDSGEEQPVAEDPQTEDQDAAYQRWESEERNRAVQQWPGWWVKESSVDAAEGDSAARTIWPDGRPGIGLVLRVTEGLRLRESEAEDWTYIVEFEGISPLWLPYLIYLVACFVAAMLLLLPSSKRLAFFFHRSVHLQSSYCAPRSSLRSTRNASTGRARRRRANIRSTIVSSPKFLHAKSVNNKSRVELSLGF